MSGSIVTLLIGGLAALTAIIFIADWLVGRWIDSHPTEEDLWDEEDSDDQ